MESSKNPRTVETLKTLNGRNNKFHCRATISSSLDPNGITYVATSRGPGNNTVLQGPSWLNGVIIKLQVVSFVAISRFSRIPNEIVIIKQMNAVCWRIIIDVPFPLLDNEGGGQRPRVSWCITVAILIINTIMLSSGTRPLPLDSESFTIITRFDGISPNTRRAITSYVNARLDECLFNRVCLGASSNIIVAKIGSGYSLRVREGLRSRSV